MSREKRMEMGEGSHQKVELAPKPQGGAKPVISAVTYSVKAMPVVPNYATQHL